MDAIWVILGIAVLGLTLLDVFLTALNYDEAGFIAGPLAALQWKLLRTITRRLSRRWRPVALRQVTGLQIMTTVFAWLSGVILGFGLVYYGFMHGNAWQYDGVHQGFFSAMYFSSAQLATVGTSQLSPNTDLLRTLSITETITGVILVSLILTFLLGIYEVISDLRALSARFVTAGDRSGAGDPVASLTPFFPDHVPTGLDSHLSSISDTLGSYMDGLRLHHAAYYFQSGRTPFSLPYAVRMVGGVTAALRWGVPAGTLSSLRPVLVPLTAQFTQFGDYLHGQLRWESRDVPETVTLEDFRRLVGEGVGFDTSPSVTWVGQFVDLNHDMEKLTAAAGLTDTDEAYGRYVEWLPFAFRAFQVTTAVSADLDYQPIIVASATKKRRHQPASPRQATVKQRLLSGYGLRPFLRRRAWLVDPGMTRLLSALRALAAAVATAVTAYAVVRTTGHTELQPAIFGGMLAMMTTSAIGTAAGAGRRATGLLATVPAVVAVLLSAVLPRTSVFSTLALVVIAFLGVWVARFGLRWGILGQLGFVAYYFALLMDLHRGDVALHLVGAVAAVAWACLFTFVLLPDRKERVLKEGVKAFEQRVVLTLDPLIDTVSWARWDPDLRGRVRGDMLQLHRSAAFLNGQLTAANHTLGLDQEQTGALRLRVFDLELAAVNLAEAARTVTGSGIPVVVRGHLAGQLEVLQEHLAHFSAVPRWAESATMIAARAAAAESGDPDGARPPSPARAVPPADWPLSARKLHRAITETYRAADNLHGASAWDLKHPTAQTRELESDVESIEASEGSDSSTASAGPTPPVAQGAHARVASAPGADPSGPSGLRLSPVDRKAVQAALATGAALSLGSLVSPAYQYWAAMPAYQVLGGTDGETFVKGAQRIAGTISGAVVGFGVAIAWGHAPGATLPLMAFAVFAASYFRPVSAPWASFWQTMLFAQLYEYLGRLSSETIELRITETVIGAVVALVVARLILPTRTRNRLDAQTADLLKVLDETTAATLDGLASGRPEPQAVRVRRILATNQRLRQITATAAPLRHAPGALDVGGIEGRLTALWATIFSSRSLLAAAEGIASGQSGVSPQEWRQLIAVTHDNIDSLVAVLLGEPSGVIHDDLGLPDEAVGGSALPEATQTVLHQLDRLNQTVLLLRTDLTPGTAGRQPAEDEPAFV